MRTRQQDSEVCTIDPRRLPSPGLRLPLSQSGSCARRPPQCAQCPGRPSTHTKGVVMTSVQDTVLHFPARRRVAPETSEQRLPDALTVELQAALAREEGLREEKRDLLQ